MDLLRVENVSFQYPLRDGFAVRNADLTVREGDFVLLTGGSGSGKTTLLKLIKKELSPAGERTGSICFKNKEVSELTAEESAKGIGFVMQNPENQIVTDKVRHELAFTLENLAVEPKTMRRRTAETAGYFGLAPYYESDTDELSGGLKQTLNLASVIAARPDLLLLDEPTSQLDPAAASRFILTLKKLNTEFGITVVIAEHRLEELFPLADQVAVMEDGRLLFCCPPGEVTAKLRSSGAKAGLTESLPTAARIYAALEEGGNAPVSVKEGRSYLASRYDITDKTFPREPYTVPEEKALTFKNIRFRYGRDLPDVLKDTTLAVGKGEIYALLGENAGGKTTMLKTAAGLLKPYAGSIRVFGKKQKDYKNGSLYAGVLAYLPQDPQTVFVQDTVKDDLTQLALSIGMTKEEAARRVAELAEKTEITHLLSCHPYDLSGGEQQKAALAKTLLSDPMLLLADEPTKGLDAAARNALKQLFFRLKSEGKTIFLVTHDVEFAAVTADRCGMLFNGELIAEEPPAAFFRGNSFYTTAADRISRGFFEGTVTTEEVIAMCRKNRKLPEGQV